MFGTWIKTLLGRNLLVLSQPISHITTSIQALLNKDLILTKTGEWKQLGKLSSLTVQIPGGSFPRLLTFTIHCAFITCFWWVGARVCIHINTCQLSPVCALASFCMCTPSAYVCSWLRVHFMMCTFFLFLVQESPSGPLGFPVPACQKRLHLLDPLEAGDSQMSLGPSTEWWDEDRKRPVGRGGGREEELIQGETEV